MEHKGEALLDYRKIESEVRARARQLKSEYVARVPQAKGLVLICLYSGWFFTAGEAKLSCWHGQKPSNLNLLATPFTFSISTFSDF